jgi:hypothetical protein
MWDARKELRDTRRRRGRCGNASSRSLWCRSKRLDATRLSEGVNDAKGAYDANICGDSAEIRIFSDNQARNYHLQDYILTDGIFCAAVAVFFPEFRETRKTRGERREGCGKWNQTARDKWRASEKQHSTTGEDDSHPPAFLCSLVKVEFSFVLYTDGFLTGKRWYCGHQG